MATDNYLEKVKHVIDGLCLPPGSRIHVLVQNDDSCQFLLGGHCNCDPTVKILRGWPNSN
jgi:hypothetical protein